MGDGIEDSLFSFLLLLILLLFAHVDTFYDVFLVFQWTTTEQDDVDVTVVTSAPRIADH